MISKSALCHILVIWTLAQVTAQSSRGNIPAAVRSSMIANGWRPLTGYEGKKSASYLPGPHAAGSTNERHSGPHPVHGKLQEHLAKSEKLSSKHNKQTHEYSPPSILGSFSVFGHSVPKSRPEAAKLSLNQVASETREFSFLVPPPRDPVRYEIDPYRKVILRDNDAYLRQPQQYILSHPGGPGDIRNSQYYQKGGAAVAASVHTLTGTQKRPVITDFNGVGSAQQALRQQLPQQQQHVPFESLKLSGAKLYLQSPSGNGAPNFPHEQQQATDSLYERYQPSLLAHNQQLSQESTGNFYSQINHPSPYKQPQNLERDPSFLVHESHEVSYPTPAGPGQSSALGAYGNFRPSSPYESLHPPERYSTLRPTVTQSDKFVPSKTDNTRQKQENYGQYSQKSGNPHLDNSIITSEPSYSSGIINTYYISGQQSLTPPAPTWSVPVKTKVTPDINEVLPKHNQPAKFNAEAVKTEGTRQSQHNNAQNFLFPRPEVQQQQQQHLQHLQHQYYPNNASPLVNQQPETTYETPESISLKHFNEQQYRLQQQLLQRDRERLREQEIQRQQQQMELGRLAASRDREKSTTTASRPIQETPRPTVQYIDTTLTYEDTNDQQRENQDIRKVPEQQYVQQEYEENVFESQRPNVESPGFYEQENVSFVPEVRTKATPQPVKTTSHDSSEVTTAGHRNRSRKPTAGNPQEQQQRRRKPTTPLYDQQTYHQEEQYHLSTLAPNPIVQSPGSIYSSSSTTEEPTTFYQGSSFPSITSVSSDSATTTTASKPTTTTTTTTTTTPKPRTRRPTSANVTNGRRRRPSSTTTPEPETTPAVTYHQEDHTRYEKIEAEPTRRRRIKPTPPSTQNHYEIEPTTSTEKKRYEIQNYGNKLGSNEQDYVTVNPESYNENVEQVSIQQSYQRGNEQDSIYYTPAYDTQVTTGQQSTDYETPGYPTSSTSFTHGISTEHESLDNAEIAKSVYTNIPLEELFVNTERAYTTTSAPTTTTTTTTTTARPATAQPTRHSHLRTTGIPATSSEAVHTTRASTHRMRPMRFGNSTRPRFSIKDYKSRLDYRSRMSSTTEPPTATIRQKTSSSSKTHQEIENQPLEPTTGRYRHMSRVSYRTTSTTPSYHSRRGDSANSTTERINKFSPKRRLNNNHLYRSKISTSTTPRSFDDENESTTSSSTRQTSVRNENVFSAAIRRRPQMKHHQHAFTQSSDIGTTRKESTEMIPEETSFYSPAITQLLVTDSSRIRYNEPSDRYLTDAERNNGAAADSASTNQSEASTTAHSPIHVVDDARPMRAEETKALGDSQATTIAPSNEPGQTEALVNDSQVTVDSQLEEDLFARASQSVADLTSSASALYDKPGMFKAVSVAPSTPEGSSSSHGSRFRINQDKPTLPIEAFFHELSNKN